MPHPCSCIETPRSSLASPAAPKLAHNKLHTSICRCSRDVAQLCYQRLQIARKGQLKPGPRRPTRCCLSWMRPCCTQSSCSAPPASRKVWLCTCQGDACACSLLPSMCCHICCTHSACSDFKLVQPNAIQQHQLYKSSECSKQNVLATAIAPCKARPSQRCTDVPWWAA